MLEEIILSGAVPRNVSVLRAELRLDHNVKNRRFLIECFALALCYEDQTKKCC